MKKICNKIKNIFIMIGVFIFSIPSKIFAELNTTEIQGLYGIPESDMPTTTTSIWDILKFFIIPIIFIIGAIIYLKKSKSKTKEKIIVIIGVAFVLVCIGYLIYYMSMNT